MNVYFIGDLHFGHKRILEFSPGRLGSTIEEHDQAIVTCWNHEVSPKKTRVYVLGDVAFTRAGLALVGRLNGEKILVRGNHDTFPTCEYLEHFKEVYGLLKYKEFWLSHAPIHPHELRGRRNIHGHVHMNTVARVRDLATPDPNYINVSLENLPGFAPISLDEVRKS
jgi:calcineurin-like phosphoesterase family protein